MIATLSILIALAAPVGETREFQAIGAFRDDGAVRTVTVSTDRDLDADGMADEGLVRFTCRGGRVSRAAFVPLAATSMIPVGRPVAHPSLPIRPTMTALFAPKSVDPQGQPLMRIAATQNWCAAR